MSFKPTEEELGRLKTRISDPDHPFNKRKNSGTSHDKFVNLQQYYTYIKDTPYPEPIKNATPREKELEYYYWDTFLPEMINKEMKKLHSEVGPVTRARVYAMNSRAGGGSRISKSKSSKSKRKSIKSKKSRKTIRRR